MSFEEYASLGAGRGRAGRVRGLAWVDLMDLDILDLGALELGSARGRRSEPLHMEVRRELNGADVEELLNPSPKGVKTMPLAKLRNTHHLLARLLAEGRSGAECSAMTGYSPSRISILKSDPAFVELVHHYQGQVEEIFVNVHERLAALGMSTIEELMERLEHDPDAISNRELMELASLCLDRSSAPPKNKASGGGGTGSAVSVSVNFVSAQPSETLLTIDMPND